MLYTLSPVRLPGAVVLLIALVAFMWAAPASGIVRRLRGVIAEKEGDLATVPLPKAP